ncbi:MAG: flagellar basal-body rod protein FlgF [Nitrospinaceae bacterium]|nr:flagellar basal-body rod protein FlgF [Nitrospinaceae bacterium]
MVEGLYIAASGGIRQQRKLETISNNLANVSTQGFKKNILMYQERTPPFGDDFKMTQTPGLHTPYTNQINEVSYVEVTQSRTDFSQGPMVSSDNPMDLALNGEGFFVIKTPNGLRYTRNGTFHLDGLGQLVNHTGDLVMTHGGSGIIVPQNTERLSVDPDGTVFGGRGLELVPLDQLKIMKFQNNNNLIKEGNGMFRSANGDRGQEATPNTQVIQGHIEKSNVNAVEEMTKLIETVRTLEAYQKIIQSIDEADDQSVNSLARVA